MDDMPCILNYRVRGIPEGILTEYGIEKRFQNNSNILRRPHRYLSKYKLYQLKIVLEFKYHAQA